MHRNHPHDFLKSQEIQHDLDVDGFVVTANAGADPLSQTLGVPVSGDGVHTVDFFAVDTADQDSDDPPKRISVNIDGTPPDVEGSASPDPNGNGWNDSDVIVTFVCSDDLSGIVDSELRAAGHLDG